MKNLSKITLIAITSLMASFVYAQQMPCTKNANGEITTTGTTDCTVQPDDYQVTIYKVGLCTSAPVATTSTALNYNNCQIVYDNPTGATVSIAKGSISNLPGSFTRPANGTYTSSFVELSPSSSIKGSNKFSYNMTGATSSYGQYCWSNGGIVYGYQNVPSNAVSCGTSAGTPAATTTVLNGFEGSATYTYSNTVNGTAVSAYLVNSDYKLPTTGAPGVSNNVYRMVGVANSSATVTSSTTSMDVSFDISNGTSVFIYTYGLNGSIQKIDSYSMGPFAPVFTVR